MKQLPTNLLNNLLKAITPEQVELIVKKLETPGIISWVNIGGKDITNTSIINIAKEPSSGVIELVTNAIDSNIQYEFLKQKEPKGLKNPRQAVEKLFGIHEGRLSNIKDTRDISNIAELTQITIFDSGIETKPTIEVRDYGIGISSNDFDKTILSLHKGNKNSKPYLMGLFGQGGSTALKFCKYRIIISRPAFCDKKKSNIVSFTIVRFNQSKVDGTMSSYEYCVNKDTGKPIEISLNDEDFKHGTLVRQIQMEIGGFFKKITVPDEQSMWYLLHHNLFDSVLPVCLYDRRPINIKYENERFSKKTNTDRVRRVVAGNNRLLTNRFKFKKNNLQDNNLEELSGVEYFQERDFKCSFGIVKVFYWVTNPRDKKGKLSEKIKQYASASSRVVFCHNGQKHHSLSRSFITKSTKENGAGFPYLDNSLIVQIELDSIDFLVKERLMTTTRESLSNIPELIELEKNLAYILSNDDKLSEFNIKRQREFRTGANESIISDEISKKISKILNGKLPKFLGDFDDISLGNGNTLLINNTNGHNEHKEKEYPEIITTDNPTYFKFDFDTKSVYPGKNFHIPFSTDANSQMITNDNLCFKIFNKTRDFCDIKFVSVINNLNHKGYGKLLFSCSDSMQVNDIVSVGVNLNSNNNVGDFVELEIKEPKEKTSEGDNEKKKGQTKYVVRKLTKDDNNFSGIFPDINIISDYREEETQIVIYLNMSHPFVEKYMFPNLESKQKNKLIIDAISDEYSSEISIQTVLQYKNDYISNAEDSVLSQLTEEDKKIIFNKVMQMSAWYLITKISSKDYIREKHFLKEIE